MASYLMPMWLAVVLVNARGLAATGTPLDWNETGLQLAIDLYGDAI